MADGYQALTEKEKETLRLLVDGYDAKSMARHLGLSVHTVNERLRDARRKMAVSSSREAARLVRAVERDDPDSLGDKRIGEATMPPAMAGRTSPDIAGPPRRRLIGGLVIMSLIAAAIALASLVGLPQDTAAPAAPAAPAGPAASTSAADAETAQAARQWLALVDAGQWQASWAASASSFRQLNTVARWTSASQLARVPLGAALERELAGVEDVPGEEVVKFRTHFANRPEAIETLALVREGRAWRVVGYYID